jgi:hypothetical protein
MLFSVSWPRLSRPSTSLLHDASKRPGCPDLGGHDTGSVSAVLGLNLAPNGRRPAIHVFAVGSARLESTLYSPRRREAAISTTLPAYSEDSRNNARTSCLRAFVVDLLKFRTIHGSLTGCHGPRKIRWRAFRLGASGPRAHLRQNYKCAARRRRSGSEAAVPRGAAPRLIVNLRPGTRETPRAIQNPQRSPPVSAPRPSQVSATQPAPCQLPCQRDPSPMPSRPSPAT